MNDDIPVVVRMRVECARCGHAADDTYAFDMPFAKAQAMEVYEAGRCRCIKAPILMYLKRTQPGQQSRSSAPVRPRGDSPVHPDGVRAIIVK